MHLTNKHGLSASYVRLAQDHLYSRGKANISVTSLLSPPRVFQLRERHNDQITVDVIDLCDSLLGTVWHNCLARYTPLSSDAEDRMYMSFKGWTISGQPDLLEDNILTDHKVTSGWSVVYGGRDEWCEQLQIYKRLAELNGKTNIKKLRNQLFIKDWSALTAKRTVGWPSRKVHIVWHEIWPTSKVDALIEERVILHQSYMNVPDSLLPVCTQDERWSKPDIWAVMKVGRKSSLKNCDTEAEANELLGKKWRDATSIDYRPGKDVRCEGWCEVNKFCSYWQGVSKKGKAA